MAASALEITAEVIKALESVKVPYFIGGSLASMVHGVVRNTLDADIVAQLHVEQLSPFVAALQDEFYLDHKMILDAIIERRSFNLIHLDTSFKVDVFIPKDEAFFNKQIERRELRSLSSDPERSAYFASAEDTILAKLEWYKLGNEVSERQWSDVLGVIKVQDDGLDKEYLQEWAQKLGLDVLLKKAFTQANQ